MREALIALLCVGDRINYVMFNEDNTDHIVIHRFIITYIDKELIRVQDDLDFCHTMWIKAIEHYNGELYIWQAKFTRFPYRSHERIMKLIEILKSKGIIRYDTGV
jgi:hypothetical protein